MKYFSALSVLLHGVLLLSWPVMETAPRHAGQDATITISLAPKLNASTPPEPLAAHSNQAAHRLPPQTEKPLPDPVKKFPHSNLPEQDSGQTGHTTASTQAPANPATSYADPYDSYAPSRKNTAALRSHIQNSLHQAITPYFHYPMLAQRRGWQGVVELGVHIDADGRLSHIWIERSSGHRILDKAAEKSLYQVTTIPDIDNNIDGHGLEMVLPVEYRLIDS